MRAFEKYKENRLAKLRLGQAVGEVVTLSGADDEDETRFVVVPLTDSENLKAFSHIDQSEFSDDTAGIAAKDELMKRAILFYAARELHDWTVPFFESMDEMGEVLDHDINHAYDLYLEMVAESSPAWYLLGDEEIEQLKKVWNLIDLRELSGNQSYAAKRFLDSIRPLLLRASFSGSVSMKKSTTTTEDETLVENA